RIGSPRELNGEDEYPSHGRTGTFRHTEGVGGPAVDLRALTTNPALLHFLRGLGLGCSLLLCLQFTCFRVFLLEAVHTSFAVYQLLPPGEERVTARADFNSQIAFMSGAR